MRIQTTHNRWILALALALLMSSLASCKATHKVGMRMILPPGAQVMDVPKDKIFLAASPVSQPMPIFPAGAPRDANINACVEIIVDESGAVSSVTPLYLLPECPLRQSEIDQRFIASTLEAARQWQFLAAAICTFPPGTPKTEDCSGNGVVISPVTIKLSYVFSFQNNGRVTVNAKRI